MKKALFLNGGWDGHQPAAIYELFERELRKRGVHASAAGSLDLLDDRDALSNFDLIIPNWTVGTITNKQEENLAAVIAAGTGLAGIHGGMGDAFRNSTGFQFMVGGQFVAHPDNEKPYRVSIANVDDPIVAGLKDFDVHTEQYFMHVDPSNRVLATTVAESVSAPWINGTVMPVAWTRRYGAGRVFYCSLGHKPQLFEHATTLEMTLRGFLWAARGEAV
ncbi:MAG: ThuA domain-containing protein [Opitutaceae bacterium]|nr:ThuA domain-containing protein [Opitutaceae bacterium]